MKVLVTGASGQLGRALVAGAPPAAQVTGWSRDALDIADRAAVEAIVTATKPDLILNAAAYTAVDQAESEEDAALLANALGPQNLALAAAAHGARLVHVSTDFVFDGTAGSPYRRDSATGPLGAYGRTKLEGERRVLAALPQALIVRTSWVYAAEGRNFLRTMLRLMVEKPELRVVADQVGSPTAVDTLAWAIWGLAGTGASGLFHVADSGVASWYDFAIAIQEEALARGLLQRPVTVNPIATADYPTPARRPAYSVLDTAATWRQLGQAAPHWRASLRQTMDRIAP